MHIGIDVGGTFTDIVCISPGGSVMVKKVSSTVDDYSRSIGESLPELLRENSVDPTSTKEVIHGTTVATNALLERAGAKTGLITTRGFRDVLELRRIRMPELYNWFWDKPPDLIERRCRKEVHERIDSQGKILTGLDSQEVVRVVQEMVAEGVESVAVCLLNSYANTIHEEEIGKTIQDRFPQLYVSLSSEILREMKEYERTATVTVNAYVLPLVRKYIAALKQSLHKIEIQSPLLIMQSNGGSITADACMKRPVFIIESGPAAGVIASLALARSAAIANAISFDMGGTTAKASIIENSELNLAAEYEVGSSLSLTSRLIKGGGHLIRVPAIDIAEVGAGGGSIACVDEGGVLQVGPRSAGAYPGPACYDLGGQKATITDANLVLGYINPGGLAGGAIQLNREKAEKELKRQVASPLGLEILDAAFGVHLIANSNMMRAIRAVSTERGRDVRDYALIAFGGSGPIHAAGIARSLGMREVIVPPAPGLFSGLGLLFADVQHDLVQTFYKNTREADLEELNRSIVSMEAEARELLQQEGYDHGRIRIERFADVRYAGQCFELTISLASGRLSREKIERLERDYSAEHEKTYGYRADDDEQYTLVNLRVRGKGLRRISSENLHFTETQQPLHNRIAYFGKEYGAVKVKAISRKGLTSEPRPGPLLIDEYDCTIVIPPETRVRRDEKGNVRIQLHS